MDLLIAIGSVEIRSGIRDILSDAMPETAFLEAADEAETLSLLNDREFSIALLDINTPGSKGLDLLHATKDICPMLPVIVLGTQPEEEYERFCLRAGAAGYVSLQNASERLLQVIEGALALKNAG
jgi:two-component system, NarL family, invasion response regulator UvrY